MTNILTTSLLTKKQQEYGLSISEDEDFIYIMKGSRPIVTLNALIVTPEQIKCETDKIVKGGE